MTTKNIPITNLVAHQKLLEWYLEADKLGQKILCPILYRIPGDWSSRTLHCDIPLSRGLYLKEKGVSRCCTKTTCIPRQRLRSEASNELSREPLRTDGTYFQRYGKEFGEPLYQRRCVICAAGHSALCYISLGPGLMDDTKAIVLSYFYQEMAEKYLLLTWHKEKRKKQVKKGLRTKIP